MLTNREAKLLQALKRISKGHLENAWDRKCKSNCPGCYAQKALKEFMREAQDVTIQVFEAL